MQCPNCQNTVPDTANVCGYCGTRLRTPAPPQPPSQPIATPPPAPIAPVYIPHVPPTPVSGRKKIPVWAWIIGIFLCLVITAWAVFFSNINIKLGSSQPTSPPTTVIQSQPQNTPIPPEPTKVVIMPSKTSPPPTQKPHVQVESINPNDKGDLPSLVSLANDQNRIEFSSSQTLYISWGWCATTPAIKEQNLEHITISFLFNNEAIPLSQFYSYESKNTDGLFCRSYHGIIRAWPVGQFNFEFLMTTDELINDGISDFPKGEIVRRTYTLNITP